MPNVLRIITYARQRQATAEARAYRALALISKSSTCYRIHAECAEHAARNFERAGKWRDVASWLIHGGADRRAKARAA